VLNGRRQNAWENDMPPLRRDFLSGFGIGDVFRQMESETRRCAIAATGGSILVTRPHPPAWVLGARSPTSTTMDSWICVDRRNEGVIRRVGG
jgi:hypothetical protein